MTTSSTSAPAAFNDDQFLRQQIGARGRVRTSEVSLFLKECSTMISLSPEIHSFSLELSPEEKMPRELRLDDRQPTRQICSTYWSGPWPHRDDAGRATTSDGDFASKPAMRTRGTGLKEEHSGIPIALRKEKRRAEKSRSSSAEAE